MRIRSSRLQNQSGTTLRDVDVRNIISIHFQSPVTKMRRDEIRQTEHSREHDLRGGHRPSQNRTGIAELQKRHQMHPLVLGFFQQRVDPPVVPLHASQRLQMTDHGRGESRHAGDRFQEDATSQHVALVQRLHVGLEGVT